MTAYALSGGSAARMGAHVVGDGVNFAVFSDHAERIELCLFTPDGSTETARIALPERSGPVWHGHLDGLQAGTVYGYRAHGPYAPQEGHRFNPNKLLLDPYGCALRGRWSNHAATYGYTLEASGDDLSFDSRDSAPHVAKGVVCAPDAPAGWQPVPPDRRDLIYEAHPKGLTMRHPGVPEAQRGTYEGLASDAMLEHLQKIGVRAVELLPVQGFVDDRFLTERGLRNYWGYNSIAFFAPEPRYLGPAGVAGFREMVARFHDAGIEVILDVVYNHTAESDHLGPTLSFRGLDNASYYRLIPEDRRHYVNDTGCGNTLNVAHPFVLRMVLDSLRHWVECFGIDGFRFDLATTLAREDHGFDTLGGFLDALRQDPVLSQVRLIAEPWDIGAGGYRLGEFPPGFGEWNDRYRDTARRFWRGDRHSAQELGARLLGSADLFDRGGRRADASVNFLTAHDGFTLADLTRHAHRHNAANGEGNRDGHHTNYSDNMGVEGPGDDPALEARRAQRRRNMLATLLLSQGTPMLLAGDEIGNGQGGNNNAYCQDNDIGWLDWPGADRALADFVARLSAFRQAHPCLRQSRFLHGATRAADGLPDVDWRDAAGAPLDWGDPALATICLCLRLSGEAPLPVAPDDAVFIVINRGPEPRDVVLPASPEGCRWVRAIDTGQPEGAGLVVAGETVVAFALVSGEAT